VLDELIPTAWHRIKQYANNPIEADHGRLKHRLRPMRGLRTDRTGQVTWCRNTSTSTALARSPRATRIINCSTWRRTTYPKDRIMTSSMPSVADPAADKSHVSPDDRVSERYRHADDPGLVPTVKSVPPSQRPGVLGPC
jgi:hypothetical protein